MEKKNPNRKRLKKIRYSRKLYLPLYIMILVLIGFMIYIKYSGRGINEMAFKVVLAFIIIIILATEIHRFGEVYHLTENAVILNSGYFGILSKRMEFEAISDMQVLQSAWQRVWNFGDLQMFKFAPGPTLKNINRPNAFAEELEKIMARAKAGEHDEE